MYKRIPVGVQFRWTFSPFDESTGTNTKWHQSSSTKIIANVFMMPHPNSYRYVWMITIHTLQKKVENWDKNLKLNFFKSTLIKLFQIKNCKIISKHPINYKTPGFLIERETAHVFPEWVAVGDELSFLRTLILHQKVSEQICYKLLQTASFPGLPSLKDIGHNLVGF